MNPTVRRVLIFASQAFAMFAMSYTVTVLAAAILVDPANSTGVDYANFLIFAAILLAPTALVIAGAVAVMAPRRVAETTT